MVARYQELSVARRYHTRLAAFAIIDVNEVAPPDTYCGLGETDYSISSTQGKELAAFRVIDVCEITALNNIGNLSGIVSDCGQRNSKQKRGNGSSQCKVVGATDLVFIHSLSGQGVSLSARHTIVGEIAE